MTLRLIGLEETTKKKLDELKEYARETYDDVIQRLLKTNERRLNKK